MVSPMAHTARSGGWHVVFANADVCKILNNKSYVQYVRPSYFYFTLVKKFSYLCTLYYILDTNDDRLDPSGLY